MFRDRIRALIDRHCLLLRDETGEIGKLLARCDPYAGAVEPADLAPARAACASVLERGEAIGIETIDRRARALDGALAALEGQERIEPWDMVAVMALQAELAAAVDELEADASELYAGCTRPAALAVAPVPPKALA